jgi:GNAT superfamily N-acetyltransferase
MREFRISTNVEEFDMLLIDRFLSQESYWAKGDALSTIRKAIANSLCFGGFLGTAQVAFGRVVTDLTTFAYLRDFFVLKEYRGNGYGKSIIQAAMLRLKEEGVHGVMLGTADAHGLYEKFGFRLIGNSSKLMVVYPQETDKITMKLAPGS